MTTYCAPCITELALVREATTTVSGTASCTAHAVLLTHPADLPGRRRQRLAELRKSAEAKQEGATEQEKLLLELLVHEYGLAGAMDVAPQGQGQGRGQRGPGGAPQGQPQGQPQGGQPSPPGEGRRSRRGKRGAEAAGVVAGVAATVAAGVVASRSGGQEQEGSAQGQAGSAEDQGGGTSDALTPTPPTTPPARTEGQAQQGASDDVVLLPGPGAVVHAPESASVPADGPAAGDPTPGVGPGTGSGAFPSEGTTGAPAAGEGEATGTGAAPSELAGGLADVEPTAAPAAPTEPDGDTRA